MIRVFCHTNDDKFYVYNNEAFNYVVSHLNMHGR